jgi:hypothetical protein
MQPHAHTDFCHFLLRYRRSLPIEYSGRLDLVPALSPMPQQDSLDGASFTSCHSLNLPYDVLFYVFSNFLHGEKQSVHDQIFDSLALVCTTWHEVSRRVRWFRVDARSAQNLETLVKRIERDAAIGLMIRQLSLSFDYYRRMVAMDEWVRWMEFSERVLRAAPKLEKLDLVRFELSRGVVNWQLTHSL